MPCSSSITLKRPKARPSKQLTSLPPHFADKPHFNTLHNPTLSNTAAAAIAGTVKPETLHRPQLAVTEFTIWANDMGLHPNKTLPAPEAVFCEFTASFLGRLAGGTVKVKVSALKTWHTTLGFKWNGADLLCCTLTGIN
ncbi:hypothetical protein D9758_016312 [Tetrapyrgos nigripes]|uniref:Uncharacterized protein n=1 Tax=Tetrapyrgos nigripes TaxID=182062 RepID=A0A8H5CK55_9AGAR|nr:hypothetical protein D9758_016312 [Tetrapyrgos nigripes]